MKDWLKSMHWCYCIADTNDNDLVQTHTHSSQPVSHYFANVKVRRGIIFTSLHTPIDCLFVPLPYNYSLSREVIKVDIQLTFSHSIMSQYVCFVVEIGRVLVVYNYRQHHRPHANLFFSFFWGHHHPIYWSVLPINLIAKHHSSATTQATCSATQQAQGQSPPQTVPLSDHSHPSSALPLTSGYKFTNHGTTNNVQCHRWNDKYWTPSQRRLLIGKTGWDVDAVGGQWWKER